MMRLLIFVGAIVLGIVAFNLVAFTVDETEQAVVQEFGRIMRVIREPGIYFKTPFVQNVVKLEDRLLSYDIRPQPIIASDKKRLIIDNYALWRIVDPKRFVETMGGDITRAQQRLDDVVYSNLRDIFGKQTLTDIIQRSGYLDEVIRLTQQQVQEFGIEVTDIRIKRADLPEENEQAVYSRMISEREQIATGIRAQGDEEAQRIRAEAGRERDIIVAEARKRSEELRGEGDAQAAEIYAKAYNRDAQFYRFWRTLDSYRKSFNAQDTLVLSTDSDYLKYFENMLQRK
ncbi:protease modulator HflC [Candidatus Acetothermia bacterium]|jgi:membrane protease subunit HflC|nr:protease modulator HflC [Candidatus Acetothermia bacterium]MCI2432251.1 protease modulator HflC [Candidatus Acetothermia bacterium]MCI2436507.1 protease modulator HflC [Candidatus Acetothermia bacterium]